KESFGKDPLQCSDCGNVMEFRGIAVPKNGRLEVQYAKDPEAKAYIEREVQAFESQAYRQKKKEAEEKAIESYRFSWEKLEKQTAAWERRISL
ncbi:hypothetical protein, partial [Alkalicoccus chagannorensis]|uniref:hypothetical protein n=1 Tax=Alkalicoccus chagannorensis TaxID=427072 RepID=UPI0039EF5107